MAISYKIEATKQDSSDNWLTIVEFTDTSSGRKYRNAFNWNKNKPIAKQISNAIANFQKELQFEINFPVKKRSRIVEDFENEIGIYLSALIETIKQNPSLTKTQAENYIASIATSDSLVNITNWITVLMKKLYSMGAIFSISWTAFRDFIVNTPLHVLMRVFE